LTKPLLSFSFLKIPIAPIHKKNILSKSKLDLIMVINRQMMDVQTNVNVIEIRCFCFLSIKIEAVLVSVQN